MADLISRAAAIKHMKSMAGCAACNNYNYVRCRACSWEDAMNIVEDMPDVDAVPVEWLREKMKWADDEGEMADVDCISWLIQTWQKEQEAQECSGI